MPQFVVYGGKAKLTRVDIIEEGGDPVPAEEALDGDHQVRSVRSEGS